MQKDCWFVAFYLYVRCGFMPWKLVQLVICGNESVKQKFCCTRLCLNIFAKDKSLLLSFGMFAFRLSPLHSGFYSCNANPTYTSIHSVPSPFFFFHIITKCYILGNDLYVVNIEFYMFI